MALAVKSLHIDPDYTITLLGEGANVWSVFVNEGVVSAKKTILIGSHAMGEARYESYTSDGCVDGGQNAGWIFQNPAPTVMTLSPTSIAPWSFRAHGSILSAGGLFCFRRGFCVMPGASGEPTIDDMVFEESGEFAIGNYSALVTGLTRDASYRIRAFAENTVGLAYGSTITVATIKTAPIVITGLPVDVTTSGAILSGTMIDTGGDNATRRGFCYVADGEIDPTVDDLVVSSAGSYGPGVFTRTLTGLERGTLYRVRAFAENAIGIGYGATQAFYTPDPTPADDIRLCQVCRTMFMDDPSMVIGETCCPACGSKMDQK